MRGSGIETKFEKEATTEPNKVGEYPPSMKSDSTGWDSLKDVPFGGNKNAFTKATTSQAQTINEPFRSNAFTKATSTTDTSHESSYDKLQSRGV